LAVNKVLVDIMSGTMSYDAVVFLLVFSFLTAFCSLLSFVELCKIEDLLRDSQRHPTSHGATPAKGNRVEG
jgi:hypothetical protein